jgi:hypothetical protein
MHVTTKDRVMQKLTCSARYCYCGGVRFSNNAHEMRALDPGLPEGSYDQYQAQAEGDAWIKDCLQAPTSH